MRRVPVLLFALWPAAPAPRRLSAWQRLAGTLLQVILIGQPELRTMLERPELEQLAQRVIARFHLDALTRPETEQYIRHRMDVAGLERPFPFESRALRRIDEVTRGVPRRINALASRLLLYGFLEKLHRFTAADRKFPGDAGGYLGSI